jgi:L-threonylcarbamoyladenylate synthase
MPTFAEPTPPAITTAAERLRGGGVVAFPTETVYGLGGLTRHVGALDRIYALKGRPADNPLIAHVRDATEARSIVTGWSQTCDRLAGLFWPGPLTLVLARADDVPARATAGRGTIAVRAPRHPVARALLEATGAPVSAPSANRSFGVSPTTAQHVAADFADVDDLLILDGGACEIGLESTVLDCTTDPPRVLRPGSVTRPMLVEAIGDVDEIEATSQAASPGTSPRHYAPRTSAALVDPDELDEQLGAGSERAAVICFDASRVPSPHRAIEMPQGAGAYARRLYAALRAADEAGCARILIECPPASNEIWRAVLDRLRRATA